MTASQIPIRRITMAALASHGNKHGALLPVLHEIQHALGFIPSEVVPDIAEGLNLSRAEVHGVITYYHHFRQSPAGLHTVQICRAESCQAVGSAALITHAEQKIGCKIHETSADGTFTLEPAYCLGQCAAGPAIMIGNVPHGRVTPEKFDRLMAQQEAKK
jgi:formate dehydrogenase subunit gamma